MHSAYEVHRSDGQRWLLEGRFPLEDRTSAEQLFQTLKLDSRVINARWLKEDFDPATGEYNSITLAEARPGGLPPVVQPPSAPPRTTAAHAQANSVSLAQSLIVPSALAIGAYGGVMGAGRWAAEDADPLLLTAFATATALLTGLAFLSNDALRRLEALLAPETKPARHRTTHPDENPSGGSNVEAPLPSAPPSAEAELREFSARLLQRMGLDLPLGDTLALALQVHLVGACAALAEHRALTAPARNSLIRHSIRNLSPGDAGPARLARLIPVFRTEPGVQLVGEGMRAMQHHLRDDRDLVDPPAEPMLTRTVEALSGVQGLVCFAVSHSAEGGATMRAVLPENEFIVPDLQALIPVLEQLRAQIVSFGNGPMPLWKSLLDDLQIAVWPQQEDAPDDMEALLQTAPRCALTLSASLSLAAIFSGLRAGASHLPPGWEAFYMSSDVTGWREEG